jgi:hypothetical protein
MIITKAELAKELHVSKPRVSNFISRGLSVRHDGRIDLEAACEWIVNFGANQGPSFVNAREWLRLLRLPDVDGGIGEQLRRQ